MVLDFATAYTLQPGLVRKAACSAARAGTAHCLMWCKLHFVDVSGFGGLVSREQEHMGACDAHKIHLTSSPKLHQAANHRALVGNVFVPSQARVLGSVLV